VSQLTAAAERFQRDTAGHQMTVLHNDGLYRHLRFRNPDRSMYWFDLVTWPGKLAFVGDVAPGYVFSRVEDMFEFFRAPAGWNLGDINPQYWAEKIVTGREGVQRYSEELFRQHVTEQVAAAAGQWPDLAATVDREILGDNADWDIAFEEGAHEALRDFNFGTFRFEDWHEWRLKDWDWSYLWCCHAIRWGIDQYDRARTAAAGEPCPT